MGDIQNNRIELRVQFHSFTWSCPVSPKPLIEETVFPPLCVLASFVID